MTKTRVIAALVMAPVAIAAILLLPTQWLVALVALVFLIGMWEWFKPVSYTHLDVYKRQQLTYDEVLTRDLQVMDTAAFALCRDSDVPLRIYDPVSYTHLDVYKRQRRRHPCRAAVRPCRGRRCAGRQGRRSEFRLRARRRVHRRRRCQGSALSLIHI